MVQAVWFDAGPGAPGLLLLRLHHLVVDGVSWRILLPDLAQAYEHIAAGRAPRLEPVGTSFRRWAQLLGAEASDPARVAELPLWTDILDTPDPLLGAGPLDRAVDGPQTVRHLTLRLPAADTEPLLTSVPAAFHAEVNDVLLTGLALAVSHWRRTAEGPVLVELEGHGREQDLVEGVNLSRTVGWFTSLFPVRLDHGPAAWHDVEAGGPSVGDALKRVKEQLRAIPDHGIGYGLLRYLNPRTRALLDHRSPPQIGFNYLGRVATGTDGDWSVVTGTEAETGPVAGTAEGPAISYVVEANAVTLDGPDGPRLSVTWSWPSRLLTDERMRALADAWFAALRGIAAHTRQAGAGGYTPSDIPLVPMSQSELDAFQDEIRARRGDSA